MSVQSFMKIEVEVWLGRAERLALSRVKVWAGWMGSHRGPGLSESAAGAGISSGVHWLVLLENRG